jgi:hypothetical protein
MADPITIALVATSVAGTVAQFSAQRESARAYDDQADAAVAEAQMNQQILEQNATLKEREAATRLEARRDEARRLQLEGERIEGAQNVGFAKGGVLSSGSPINVLEQTASELDADRRNILKRGFLERQFGLAEASNLRYQGQMELVRGENAKRGYKSAAKGARLSSYGTLLTGAGTAAFMGMRPRTPYSHDQYLARKHGIA